MRILHLFNWQLNNIIGEVPKIKEQGFDAIQINPLQPLKEDNFENWWLSYQPCNLTIGNQYGSKEDLKNLCDVCHNYGVQVYADVVLTHMAGSKDGSLEPDNKVDEELIRRSDFWKERKNIMNWESRYEVTNYCPGLPSLNLQNHDLQIQVLLFLNDLIDLGVDGFRYDSAKSIKTPSEGPNDFFPNVVANVKKNVYQYGEVIFANEELIQMYIPYIDVLTNTWSRYKDNTVVFAESHDSYLSDGMSYTKDKSSKEITKEYLNLTKYYPKTLYYARSFDDEWKREEVKEANKILVKR